MICSHIPPFSHGTCKLIEGKRPPMGDEQIVERIVSSDTPPAENGATEMLIIKELRIPNLSDEDYEARPVIPETNEDSTCGVDSLHHHEHVGNATKEHGHSPPGAEWTTGKVNPFKKFLKSLYQFTAMRVDDDDYAIDTTQFTIPTCGESICDNPELRDVFTTPLNAKYKIEFIYYDCDRIKWAEEAPDRIAEALYDLNQMYREIGIEFFGTLRLIKCPASWGSDLIVDHDNFVKLINQAYPTEGETQISRGNFQVLVGVNLDGYNGWAYLPSSRTYAGLAFMNYKVVRKQVSTLAHELGHAFGLKHTFAGVTGVSQSDGDACPICFDNANSDLKGDFVSDTPSIPKNFECESTIPASKYDPDLCQPDRKVWKNNPYLNIMSYGVCRKSFSPQQIRRVRCFVNVEMPWLKNYNTVPMRECEDVNPECKTLLSYCGNREYFDYMAQHCMRSCEYCSENEHNSESSSQRNAIEASAGSCVDEHTSCESWKNAGYCSTSSVYYPYMVQTCPKTCAVCSEDDTEDEDEIAVSVAKKILKRMIAEDEESVGMMDGFFGF